MEDKICILCKRPYTGYGHNPAPITKEGRCCYTCNMIKVVPIRMEIIMRFRQEDEEE